MNKIFITGTDTSVGKTLVSAGLSYHLKSYYWKPIQTGSNEKKDSQFLSRFIEKKKILPEAYIFKNPLSPNQASELEHKEIELSVIHTYFKKISKNKKLVIEGAGGVFVPLNKKNHMMDLMKKFKIPVLLVARSGLGTLNHSLLSLEALRRRDLHVLGLVLVGKPHPYNKKTLEAWGKIKVLWEVKWKATLSEKKIKEDILRKEFSGFEKVVGESLKRMS